MSCGVHTLVMLGGHELNQTILCTFTCALVEYLGQTCYVQFGEICIWVGFIRGGSTQPGKGLMFEPLFKNVRNI